MLEEINEGFWISDYVQTQIEHNSDLYKFFKKNVERFGYYQVKVKENPVVKIYTAELAMVLCGNEIDGINTFPYLELYSKAYCKGVEYFKEHHLATSKILYGEYAKLYVKEIHNNYFHINHGNAFIGWYKVKSMYPSNLYISDIEHFAFYSGIVSEVDLMTDMHFELFKELDKGCDCEGFIKFQQIRINKEIIKPTTPHPLNSENLYNLKLNFKPESIQSITDTLNTFFEATQHAELKRIIETGSKATEKLFFRDNGNKLSDYFKRLFENNTIVGCTKKDLISWIVENFVFNYRQERKEFIFKTVEKTISGNAQPCKNPII